MKADGDTIWKITVLGVRGATPVADRNFMEYGGNTSCISVDYGDGILCFDAGSGLAGLGGRLAEIERLDILIGHMHMDHIIGLYGLSAMCRPGLEIHLYGEARQGISFRKQLETFLGRPYWPLELCELPVQPVIHEIGAGESFILCGREGKEIRVSTLRGNHPGGSLIYRIESEKRSVVYTLDCEMNEETFSSLTEFARDSSLLIWDGNFVREDKKDGWGHSTWEEGLELGREAGVERVLVTHYAKEYSDQFLHGQEQLAAQKDHGCRFAREGMVIQL